MSHIVLIEDDPIHAFIAQRILQKSDKVTKLTTFAHGKEAYEGLKIMGENRPDLIFLDINMPIWDGWQFLQAFQKHEDWAHIPVYVLTSSTDRMDREMAISFGLGDHYLVKPLTAASCQDILQRHFDKN